MAEKKGTNQPLCFTRRELLASGAALVGLSACGGFGSSLNTPEGGACPSGVAAGNAPSTYVAGQPVYLSQPNAFVIRDGGGLYALSAACTHAGCAVELSGGSFFCPCHGSAFDINGNVLGGPAPSPLPHLAMCLNSDGTIGVDDTTTVDPSARLAK